MVIGGGLSRASHLFLDAGVQEAGSRALACPVARGYGFARQGGPAGGVIGAGLLAEHEIRNTETATTWPDRGNRMTTSSDQLEELSINTIRTLSMDAVQKANSGHPGTPMALAPLAYVLYTRDHAPQPVQPRVGGPRPVRASAATRRCCSTRCSTSRATR